MLKQVGLFMCVLGLAGTTSGQSDWSFSGNTTFSSDLYSFKSNDASIRGRRPPALSRWVFNSRLRNSKSDFQMPISVAISANRTNAVYPNQPSDLKSFFQNPANMIRIAPQYKSLTVEAGRIFPEYSELTLGNISLLGVNIKLNPKFGYLQMSTGNSRSAIEADSTFGFDGSYAQRIRALQIGIGQKTRNFWGFQVVQSEDDPFSIKRHTESPPAESGLAFSTSFGLKFIDKVHWVNEVALSLHTLNTMNTLGLEEAQEFNPVPSLITLNATSRVDFAGSSTIQVNAPLWSLKLKGLYVGPGYATFGYPFFQNDRLDFTASPSFRLLKNKLIWNTTAGYRVNNVLETKSQTSTQILFSSNATAILSNQFTVNAMVTNFGQRNDFSSDSLKIQNVSNSFSLSPNYRFNTEKLEHNVGFSYNLNQFGEFNTVSGETQTQNSTSANINYSAAIKGSTWILDASLMHFNNKVPDFGSELQGLQLGASKRFFERKWKVAFHNSFNWINREGVDDGDLKYGFRVKSDYNWKLYKLKTTISRNHYSYGSFNPGAYFREWFVQLAVSMRF